MTTTPAKRIHQGKNPNATVPACFSLPRLLTEQLARAAKREDTSRSRLVARAVRAFLASLPDRDV
jgi:hypothetical protein